MKLAHDYPVQLLCALVDLPRSTFYYAAQRRAEATLQEQIRTVSGTWPTYGIRRVTKQITRDYVRVNRKRVARVMRALNLTRKTKHKTHHTTDSQHGFPRYPNLVQDLAIIRPEQVWVADITYIQLATECVYLAVIMDVFTRLIRGWHLSRALDQDLTITALRRALDKSRAEIHHSDQGLQYAATDYVALLKAQGLAISMAEVGQAWQNGYAERVMRTIKEEEVNLSDYRDYFDAYEHVGRFLDDVYGHKRIHSALGYLTPAEFEAQWRAQQMTTAGIQ